MIFFFVEAQNTSTPLPTKLEESAGDKKKDVTDMTKTEEECPVLESQLKLAVQVLNSIMLPSLNINSYPILWHQALLPCQLLFNVLHVVLRGGAILLTSPVESDLCLFQKFYV